MKLSFIHELRWMFESDLLPKEWILILCKMIKRRIEK